MNIDINDAVDTALQYTNKYELHAYGLEPQDLYTPVDLTLDNNYGVFVKSVWNA